MDCERPSPAPSRRDSLNPPPLDLAAWLANRLGPAPVRNQDPNPAAPPGLNPSPAPNPKAATARAANRSPRPTDSRGRILQRAAAYLAKLPPAVAGERGHNRTFHAACVLIKGFDLTIDEARPLLGAWNSGCLPPWSAAELEHKLRSAAAAADTRPRGYLLTGSLRANPRSAIAPVPTAPKQGADANQQPGGSCPTVSSSDSQAGAAAGSCHRGAAGGAAGSSGKRRELAEGTLADAGRADPGRSPRRLPSGTVGPFPPEASDAEEPTGAEVSDPAALEAAEGRESNPHRLALLFLRDNVANAGGIGLRYWQEEFLLWDGSAYRRIPTGEVRAQVTQTLTREFERLFQGVQQRRGIEAVAGGQSRRPPRPLAVTGRLVSDVVQAVAGLILVRTLDCPRQPAWLEPFPELTAPLAKMPPPAPARAEASRISGRWWSDVSTAAANWPATEVLPARNALVHLPSFAAGRPCAVPPTPRLFNAYALDYDFDPQAPEPAGWLAFLAQVWADDPESIRCLQEWFGYLLTPDTSQQKILMMVGPKRSGRGTIARVLKALVGAGNVVNPTLATLARPFGLAPLIDKPIAIFPDARLSSRPDNAAIVESLLSISGEDDQTIDRKHLPAWTGRLPTRFVLISNELPRLRDSSGALASRLVILRFTRSFYNREDTGLFDRLSAELPGILLWAVAGWKRLRDRGRFLQPSSARDLVAMMDELASPIAAFLDDRCVRDPHATVPAAELYEAWRNWCQERGREAVGDEQAFGRDLHAAIAGLTKSRYRKHGLRVAHYNGIRLRTALDTDSTPPSPPPLPNT